MRMETYILSMQMASQQIMLILLATFNLALDKLMFLISSETFMIDIYRHHMMQMYQSMEPYQGTMERFKLVAQPRLLLVGIFLTRPIPIPALLYLVVDSKYWPKAPSHFLINPGQQLPVV